jgi:hypothetical protein
MPTCDHCGNDYDAAMTIDVPGGGSGTFDSFECAIHVLAPTCAHCECRIIGHGVQAGDRIFCCAHCAREAGEDALTDRTV